MKKIKISRLICLSLTIAITCSFFGCAQTDNKKEVEEKYVVPEESTFFSTVSIEDASSSSSYSDGDLWPCAWSDDDMIYASNGDGKGFDLTGMFSEIVVNKISGNPNDKNIEGTRLSSADEIGQIWNPDLDLYNRKPTGMISVDGNLYLAVQDLNKGAGTAFDDVPAATILKSTDKGVTWTWDKTKPMFSDHKFTTIIFLDFGKNNENAINKYVYAYGLDYNWRDSFTNQVEDPTKLYLARVPKTSIQDRSKWEFYTGDLKGKAAWSSNFDKRKPILRDDERVYPKKLEGVDGINDMTQISQGSVVYNKPLNRYIYTSWTEYTFEFFEAPKPWGPWKKFITKDFGAYPWTETKHGGYATVIPSKFISKDGNEMWVASSTFMSGINNYQFAMRKLSVSKYTKTKPSNKINDDNLALSKNAPGVTAICKSAHYGNVKFINDGDLNQSEDSWNGEAKTQDWWGYTWPKEYNMNKLVYITGTIFDADGGWFNNYKIQVRQNFIWKDVSNMSANPNYTCDMKVGPNKTYIFNFDEINGDGIRIIGEPGGNSKYSSIAELQVFYSK